MQLLLIALSLFLSAAPTMAEALDWIAARVNDEIILHSEVLGRMHDLKESGSSMGAPIPANLTEQDVLKLLIRERLTDQEIKRLKINVGKVEVDRALDEIKRDNGISDAQLEYLLGQQGKTVAQFRENIQKEIERSRLIERVFKSKIVVTDQEVDSYLQQAGGNLGGKEKRRLAVIFLPFTEGGGREAAERVEEQAEKIRSGLAAGGDFAKAARDHSKGPGAQDGGDIGFIATEDLAPAIEAATRGLQKGEMTKVLKTPTGCYIFKALDIQRASSGGDSKDPAVREKARKQLMQQEMNSRYEGWIKDLESKSFIEIHTMPDSTSAKAQPSS